MVNISDSLQQSLTVFVYIAAFLLVCISILLVKVFFDLSKLIISVDNLVEIINYEFTPTIREVQKTLKHISSISDNADKQIIKISGTIDSATNTTSSVMTRAKIGLSSVIAGLLEVIKSVVPSNTKK